MARVKPFTENRVATKRNPSTGSARSVAVTQIPLFYCGPLDPVEPELQVRMQLKGPMETLQTFVKGTHDIREGDTLVLLDTDEEFPIRAVAAWQQWDGSTLYQLFLEDKK